MRHVLGAGMKAGDLIGHEFMGIVEVILPVPHSALLRCEPATIACMWHQILEEEQGCGPCRRMWAPK